MTEPALDAFLDAIAELTVDGGESRQVSAAAAEALAVGFDSPSLRMLAGEPSTSVASEIAELIASTLAELRGVIPPMSDEQAVQRVLRVQCERHLRGELSARALGQWVAEHCSWNENRETHAILVLDDSIDDLEMLGGEWSGPPREELEAELTATARLVLANYPRE